MGWQAQSLVRIQAPGGHPLSGAQLQFNQWLERIDLLTGQAQRLQAWSNQHLYGHVQTLGELARQRAALGRAIALLLHGRLSGGELTAAQQRTARARVRSILRRRQPQDPVPEVRQRRYARFLDWSWDCAANTLRDPAGEEHVLGNAESRVLKAFLERPHQILTREQLLGQRDLSPMDRSIDVRISRIRRKLEPDPQNPKIIKTVYGAGYMFTAAVIWS